MPENKNLIITNNGVLPISAINSAISNSEQSVYEVVRLIDGIPLFLEDHVERLISSAVIAGFHLEMKISDFRNNILKLAEINYIENGNVKFVVAGTEANNWAFAFIPHSYPSANDYLTGVSVGLLFAERENPTAKIMHYGVRAGADKLMADHGFYEVLLVDRKGFITEGSRSNVFFVKDEVFYTAPASMVLSGVTRKKVFECFNSLGFKVVEAAVAVSKISEFDSVFLTGTSPKILHVSSIGKVQFQVSNVFVENLMESFNLMIEKYLAERK